MTRSVTALAALLLALALSGCSLFGKVVDPKKDWQAADYYKAAKEEFDSQNWDAAIKLYDQLEAKFPFGRFAQQANLEVAYAYYKQGETAQAVTALEKFVKLHPNHPNVDYALYLKALANFKEDLGPFSKLITQDLADRDPKAARESFEGFKDLVTRFPESRYTPDSRERMAYLVEALARHEVNVARYYLARGAYLAAANRAQETIVRFPNSPTHRDSLDIMIEAYDRMGMTELRDDTKRVLAKNYPTDPLGQSGKNRTGSWWQFWK
ncbi:MAG: outer membrane protein assembly factor BamD [Usitatibacter sp.]